MRVAARRCCSRLFTVFTAMSIFGVFLGTAAPIIALSVMSGFENDLKTKIRSTKADVVIDPQRRPAVHRLAGGATQKLAGIPGIAGSMPYVEAEVIVKHATNPAGMGIILRGIDPARAPRVLGLERTLREGKIEYLAHPDADPRRAAAMIDSRGPTDDAADGRRGEADPRRGRGAGARAAGHPAGRGAVPAHPARLRRQRGRRRLPDVRRRAGRADAQAEAVPGGRPLLQRHVRVRFQAGLRRRCATPRSSWTCPGEVTGIEIRTRHARRRRRAVADGDRAPPRAGLRGPVVGGAEPRVCSWRSSWRRSRCSSCSPSSRWWRRSRSSPT